MSNLSSLMLPSKTVDFEYPGFPGLKISLCFLAREELVKLRKKSTGKNWDKSIGAPVESMDEEKFLKLYVEQVIKGWSGFKYKYLEEFLLVDLSSVDPDDELPFSQEDAMHLMKNSNGFDTWVTEMANNLENFSGSK